MRQVMTRFGWTRDELTRDLEERSRYLEKMSFVERLTTQQQVAEAIKRFYMDKSRR